MMNFGHVLEGCNIFADGEELEHLVCEIFELELCG